ncbi:MAG TPA: autoantigen p27 domain-containing protein [Nitrososphaeraceae archaeon]|nr:autoantigen p27 domain-containing protein [Nitrososphaeraceae archaeon]
MSDGKSSSSSSESGNIKSAADLLLKGGTLLSNSCENCGGVQVRFKEDIVCANCGRKIKELNVKQIEEEKKIMSDSNNNNGNSGLSQEIKVQSTSSDDSGNIKLASYTRVIYKKITLLIASLENDSDDILVQNAKLDLISKYFDVLHKIKVIDKEGQ